MGKGKKMAKKQKVDRLAHEAALALAAGMSYGKWKAMQPPVEPDVYDGIAPGWRVCKCCGKPFKPKTQNKQIYCEIYCQKQAQYERDRQRRAKEVAE